MQGLYYITVLMHLISTCSCYVLVQCNVSFLFYLILAVRRMRLKFNCYDALPGHPCTCTLVMSTVEQWVDWLSDWFFCIIIQDGRTRKTYKYNIDKQLVARLGLCVRMRYAMRDEERGLYYYFLLSYFHNGKFRMTLDYRNWNSFFK